MMPVDQSVRNKLAKMSFLCALLVVVLHVGIGPAWIKRALAITGIAVPFFFVAAGFLFAGRMDEPGWYARQCKSRFRSLVIPYVIWNILYWGFIVAMTLGLRAVGVEYGGLKLIEDFMGARWDILGLMPLSFSALGLLWFVRCLILLVLVSPILLLLRRRYSWIWLVVAYGALVVYNCLVRTDGEVWVRPWLIAGWLRSVVYFSLGVWFRFNGVERLKLPRYSGVVMLAVGWLMLASYVQPLPVLGVLVAMTGMWATLDAGAWSKVLTGCSFPIYVLHAFMGVVAAAAISVCGFKAISEDSIVAFVLKWLFMAGGSILLTIGFRRFMPRVANAMFGGR